MSKFFDVLLWKDDPDFEPGIPPARPSLILPAARRKAPWVTMDPAQVRAAVASTQAAWDAWEASRPPLEVFTPSVLTGADGSLWNVDAAGKLVPA